MAADVASVGSGRRLAVLFAIMLLAGTCGGDHTVPTEPSPPTSPAGPEAPPGPAPGPAPDPGPAVAALIGAGDISTCANDGDESTARVLDRHDGTIFTVGDNVYESGTAQEFRNCYAPTWGRHLARTRPSPGNHEYRSAGAAPYYAYFGSNAGPGGLGYYSYDLGGWHIISLNSNADARPGSPQYEWLRADLAASQAGCEAAYWHHPVFSSGDHGNDSRMRPVWRLLYENGVDVILNGHDHNYERFGPQDPDGRPDAARGIRQFVVGTGGKNLDTEFKSVQPNSEVRDGSAFGVLRLTLRTAGYDWEFLPAAGGSFRDSGSDSCR
jgi:hypothetical protein